MYRKNHAQERPHSPKPASRAHTFSSVATENKFGVKSTSDNSFRVAAHFATRLPAMIRRCDNHDFELIWTIINEAAQAYKGIIPADRWKVPYMSRNELQHEIDDGVVFWGFDEAGTLAGVMGVQQVQDVTLIRHAYVRANGQRRGIGAQLLSHLRARTKNPVLIGTWADAAWAIRFYEKHGFQTVPSGEKNRLLKKYWTIPERQMETSVVLADPRWWELSIGS